MDGLKTTLAFFAGIAVGVAIGTCMAPEKGSELRQKIADRMKKTGNDLVNAVTGGISDITNSITSKMKEDTSNGPVF